jgi:hypothetical protein
MYPDSPKEAHFDTLRRLYHHLEQAGHNETDSRMDLQESQLEGQTLASCPWRQKLFVLQGRGKDAIGTTTAQLHSD